MITKNWKPYILGFLTGVVLTGLFFTLTNKENNSSTDTPIEVTNISETSVSKKKKAITKEKSKTGTLTNPIPLGDYAEFSDKELLGDQTFEIGAKIEEFKPAQELPNFEARFYNSDTLKENNTFYGAKINIKVLDGSDQDTTYLFDALNSIHVYVDGSESSDHVIDINQNKYSGITGNIMIGADKTGWFGFQAPNDAKSILIKVGSFGSNFYMKLK